MNKSLFYHSVKGLRRTNEDKISFYSLIYNINE